MLLRLLFRFILTPFKCFLNLLLILLFILEFRGCAFSNYLFYSLFILYVIVFILRETSAWYKNEFNYVI